MYIHFVKLCKISICKFKKNVNCIIILFNYLIILPLLVSLNKKFKKEQLCHYSRRIKNIFKYRH